MSGTRRWLYGRDLIKLFPINDLDLLDFVRNQNLTAYDQFALNPVPPNDLEDPIPMNGSALEYSIKEILLDFAFKAAEVFKFMEEHGISQNRQASGGDAEAVKVIGDPSTAEAPIIQSEKDIDKFVKALRISAESDYKIKMQETPGKRWKSMDLKPWGSKERQALIRYLKESMGHPHTFSFGQDGKNASDRRRKRLDEACKKLLDFISQEYSQTFPKGYKLYEKCKGEQSGTYRFKFITLSQEPQMHFDKLSEDELLSRISKVSDSLEGLKNDPGLSELQYNIYKNRFIDEIKQMVAAALKIGVSKDDLKDYIV